MKIYFENTIKICKCISSMFKYCYLYSRRRFLLGMRDSRFERGVFHFTPAGVGFSYCATQTTTRVATTLDEHNLAMVRLFREGQ